jgi:GMP synthase (glutamine-hydrolysing)
VIPVKPFLLLATRPEDDAADDEYAAFLRFAGLDEPQMHRIRLDRRPLGDVDPDDWSGILLGGGPFNSSDPAHAKSPVQRRVEAELHALLDRVVADDVPFLGACYGIGTLGTHQGAVVDRTYAEPVGAVTVTLTDAGRADPLFAALPGSFEAFVGHKEAVTKLPGDAVRLAGSATCPVQAFRMGSHVYATQFHPELDVAGICTRIEIYRHAGYFEPHLAEDLKAAARTSVVVDPPKLLRGFVRRYARPADAGRRRAR